MDPNVGGNNMTRELYDLTALELSHAYRSKELSPVEVTRAVLARIETWGAKAQCDVHH
jgi:Asp-tRNA(Asn)/Glu-tRNA(Gln) amidotransferase A subunit family amidase